MSEPMFTVSREDWSLHRKGYQDQTRHQQKVRDAIKQNLPDLVTDESIVMSDGKQIVKVPIRSLDEYRFRYNYNKSKHVGQGTGDSQVGDVLGVDPQAAQGPGKGEGAGDQPGEDYYDAEVQMEELQTMLFDELELPNLEQKEKENVVSKEIIFNDVRKKGIMSNIDKKAHHPGELAAKFPRWLPRDSSHQSGRPAVSHVGGNCYPAIERFDSCDDGYFRQYGVLRKIYRPQLFLLDDPLPADEI